MEKNKKLLLVEDDELVAQAYLFFLQNAGFTVEHVTNGRMVLPAASKNKPDLILLDLIILGINGFDVLARLKKSPLKKIPVIIISNLGQEADEVRCRELGAVDYIIKSNLSMVQVLERINLVLTNGSP